MKMPKITKLVFPLFISCGLLAFPVLQAQYSPEDEDFVDEYLDDDEDEESNKKVIEKKSKPKSKPAAAKPHKKVAPKAKVATPKKPVKKTKPIAKAKPVKKSEPKVVKSPKPAKKAVYKKKVYAKSPAPKPSVGENAITLLVPQTIKRRYDEMNPLTTLKWKPAGNYYLLMSKNKNLNPVYKKFRVKGRSSIKIKNLTPGKWYWRLVEKNGDITPIYAIHVRGSKPLNLAVKNPSHPKPLEITDQSDPLYWDSDNAVAYYSLEVANDKNFQNFIKKFRTAKNHVKVTDLPTGSYFARLSGFNKRSGKWEYSKTIRISIK